MKAGHDEHCVIDDPEEKSVGESAQQRTADVGKDKRKLRRIGGQSLGSLVELRTEASSQTGGLSFVPVLRVTCFALRRGQENDRVHQGARRASWALSCSQVMPPERSCSKLLSRHLSSAR